MHTAYMRHLAHAWRTLKLISYSLALCLWRSCYLMAALGMGTESKPLTIYILVDFASPFGLSGMRCAAITSFSSA